MARLSGLVDGNTAFRSGECLAPVLVLVLEDEEGGVGGSSLWRYWTVLVRLGIEGRTGTSAGTFVRPPPGARARFPLCEGPRSNKGALIPLAMESNARRESIRSGYLVLLLLISDVPSTVETSLLVRQWREEEIVLLMDALGACAAQGTDWLGPRGRYWVG